MSIRQRKLAALSAIALFLGCQAVHQVRDPDYADVSRAIHQAVHSNVPAADVANPIRHELAGPQHVETYVQYALAQSPDIQAARKRVEAAAMRVPQAASLKDPMLAATGWPFFPHTPQTAAGRMTVDLMVSQEVPWFGKLYTRAAAAEAEVNAARAQLAAVELKVIESVKQAYYRLDYADKAIRVTEEDRAALSDLAAVVNLLYRSNRASQQEMLRLDAELANVEVELIQMQQEYAAAQAELAGVLHVSPETPLGVMGTLSPDDVPADLDTLYQKAIAARPELHATLAEIERNRKMVHLARLDYYPDATFNLGWGEMTTNRALAPSADGVDNLALGLSLNLPLYRQRRHAAVREAEATVVANARRYDQLKDETQREVKQLFTLANSQRDAEALFREVIIPKTKQALEVSLRGYEAGDTEFADLIANWRELLRFHRTQLQLESQLRQTLASLERVVGGLPASTPRIELLPPPLVES